MGSIQKELVDIADTFVALQEERHTADYDVTKKFLRVDVLQKINEVQQAFLDWKNVRQEPNANVFLAALLLQDTWNK